MSYVILLDIGVGLKRGEFIGPWPANRQSELKFHAYVDGAIALCPYCQATLDSVKSVMTYKFTNMEQTRHENKFEGINSSSTDKW